MQQFWRLGRLIAVIIAVCCSDLFCNQARAIDYQLSVVAKQGDIIGGKTLTGLDSATINNVGQVTYRGIFSDGKALITSNSIILKTGDVIDGKTISDIGLSNVNDVGDLVFVGSFSGVSGIFAKSKLIAQPGTSIGGLVITDFGSFTQPSINNNGTVGFVAGISGGRALFTENAVVAAPFTVIDSTVITGFSNGGRVDVSDTGRILFKATTGSGDNYFTQNRRIYAPGMMYGSLTAAGANWVGMNEWDDVGITVIPTGSRPRTIVVDDVQVISESSSIDGLPVSNFSSESLNDFGRVAFTANINIPGLGSGIFTPTDEVAGPGSIVGGGILSNCFGSVLNNNGDVVFLADFLNGTRGVILAKPINPGDYNGDAKVDAADYVVWRKNPTAFGGEPNGYNTWRAHFGKSFTGVGSSTLAVPEPSVCALAAIVICALSYRTRRIDPPLARQTSPRLARAT
jgi:hypothetical protein